MSVEFLSVNFLSKDGSDDNPGLTNFVHTPRSNEGIKQSGIKEKLIKFLI
jgi:hypothetical protein